MSSEAENPDLICLQEVDRGVRLDRAFRRSAQPSGRSLPTRPGILFQPNVHLRTGVYRQPAARARWKFRSKHQISLRLNNKKVRGAQLAVVDTPEGPLHVVHVHLGLGERERHWQVEHLLGHHLFQEAINRICRR